MSNSFVRVSLIVINNSNVAKQDGAKPNFSQLISELDCYIGHADGYSYGSYDRLLRMRKKGIVKPVGNI